MYSGHPPFERATESDRYFKYIMNNRLDTFWKKHEKYHEEGFFTPEFKELIAGMFSVQPAFRPALIDLMGCQWLNNGEIATQNQVFVEMERR